MKNQMTALLTLASLGWSFTTFANDMQASQLQPVSSPLITIEINVEQPELDVKSSIINQVNENLQPQLAANGAILIARENSLMPAPEASARAE